MEGWRCKTGRRGSKKSRGGDCRWVVSTGMLMLRRKPCLLVGWTGKEARQASGRGGTNIKAHSRKGKGTPQHLNKGGGLVERHLSRGNVQSEPGRLLPLQAAGALPLRFSHVLRASPGLPATRRQEEGCRLVSNRPVVGTQPHHKTVLSGFWLCIFLFAA